MYDVTAKEAIIYLAGIIDGEGHFYKPFVVNGRGERTRYARIVVVNTSKELIDWLVDTFSGNVTSLKRQSPTHKQCYRWQLQGKQAELVATQVKPYLIVKREQVLRVVQ